MTETLKYQHFFPQNVCSCQYDVDDAEVGNYVVWLREGRILGERQGWNKQVSKVERPERLSSPRSVIPGQQFI